MKIIKYNICHMANHGTEENPQMLEVFFPVEMGWNEANEEIAKKEAHNGEYIIEEIEDEKTAEPTKLDKIEAQVTYTAMMTDTLLEV